MISVALISGERPKILEWIGFIVGIWRFDLSCFSRTRIAAAFSIGFNGFCRNRLGILHASRQILRQIRLLTRPKILSARFRLIIIVSVPFILWMKLSWSGVLYAVLSGAIASGIGYAVWYAALKYHTATRAAILQLSVPAIAAIGGVIFLSETISVRLLLASGLILGGIGLAIWGRKSLAESKSK